MRKAERRPRRGVFVKRSPLPAAAERRVRVGGYSLFGGDGHGGGGRLLPPTAAERLLHLRHVRADGVSGVDRDDALGDAIQSSSCLGRLELAPRDGQIDTTSVYA